MSPRTVRDVEREVAHEALRHWDSLRRRRAVRCRAVEESGAQTRDDAKPPRSLSAREAGRRPVAPAAQRTDAGRCGAGVWQWCCTGTYHNRQRAVQVVAYTAPQHRKFEWCVSRMSGSACKRSATKPYHAAEGRLTRRRWKGPPKGGIFGVEASVTFQSGQSYSQHALILQAEVSARQRR